MIRHKILTAAELETIMGGGVVRWTDPPLDADEIRLEPPAHLRDSCRVSYSLHRAIVARLEARLAEALGDLAAKESRLKSPPSA